MTGMSMADRQIRGLEPQDLPLGQRVRQRGLISQISTALLQPVYFFRTLPTMGETRQWLWIALLVMLLVGFSAVRQQELVGDSTESPPINDVLPGGDLGFAPGGDFGGPPVDGGFPGGVTPTTSGDTTTTLTTGIIAASGALVSWLILMVLLALASLLRGRAPRLGHNFQIAIWASLPLAVMAILQILYYAAGGMVRQPGVAGILVEWQGFSTQAPFVQALLLSLASLLTVFWLWSLMMIYFGARFALHGRRWSALLVVLSWIAVSVMLPIATGAIKIPETTSVEGNFMGNGNIFPGGEFENGEFNPERPSEPPTDREMIQGEGITATEEAIPRKP